MTNVQNVMLARFTVIMTAQGLSAIPVAALADRFNGTSGDDNIIGTNEDDEIFTDAGSDTVKGRGGDDTFTSEDESVRSTFTGEQGGDDFQCGPVHDIVRITIETKATR